MSRQWVCREGCDFPVIFGSFQAERPAEGFLNLCGPQTENGSVLPCGPEGIRFILKIEEKKLLPGREHMTYNVLVADIRFARWAHWSGHAPHGKPRRR